MSIDQVINLLAAITLFEMMIAIGLGVTITEIAGIARNGRLLLRAAAANYVGVPAVALGLLIVFDAQPLVAAGFLVAAVCPGAPFGPPFTGLARGNVVVAVGLMVVLAGSSALLAPILLQLLLPLVAGDQSLPINSVKIATTLLVTQLLPLGIGLAMRQWRPLLADRLKRPASLLSTVLNLALLGLILVVQRDMLIGIPLRAFAGMFLLLSATLAIGWLLGEPGGAQRKTLAITTAVRNAGVCLVIASSSFAGTPAVTAVTAYALLQTIVMALVALAWGRRNLTSERVGMSQSVVM
ncbi:MAG: bile acid:sodium symporter [Gemmataceae bacterium]|nr:bile acid:sodium symporter [Gemmataceae bacterium]MCI0739504.1 bile acid:sodium symporter [Gemmataceae bacterium]